MPRWTKDLTEKQKVVLSAIEDHWRETGIAPSVADIATRTSLLRSNVYQYLMALKRKGALVHVFGQGRSWRPTKLIGRETEQRVPIIGRVAAGAPLFANENIEGYISVENLHASQTYFALRIRGTSMVDAGILDGDIVIVRKQENAENEDIVVVVVKDGDATVKRFRHDARKVWLIPESKDHQPIEVEEGPFYIMGKVVALRRQYE